MKQLSSAVRLAVPLALLSVFPLSTPSGDYIRAAVNNPATQESKQSQKKNKSTDEVLKEASQLSLTVVRLFTEGRYDEALPLAKRALELRETALDPDHEMVQVALLNLAEIYTATKKYGDAQKLIERLLKTYEQKVGPEDAGAAVYLDKLAFLSYMKGDFSKSEAAYKRALSIREKVFGPTHAEFATSLYLLAELYRFTGKPDKAQPLYEQAVVLRRKLLGRDDPEYLKARERYFCLAFSSSQASREKTLKDFAAKVADPADSASVPLEGQLLNGRAISLPRPAYPEEARRARA